MARLFALKHCFAHITTPNHTSSIVPRGPKMNSKLLSRFSDACKNWHCPFSVIPSAPGACSNPTLRPHCWSHCSGKCASLFCLPSLSSAPNGPFLQPPSGSHCTDPISSLKLPFRQHPAWTLSPCRTVTLGGLEGSGYRLPRFPSISRITTIFQPSALLRIWSSLVRVDWEALLSLSLLLSLGFTLLESRPVTGLPIHLSPGLSNT